jgi:hypothetical protein
VSRWGGDRVTRARAALAARVDWPTPCVRCGRPVYPTAWHLDHIPSRSQLDPAEWDNPAHHYVSHVRCNTRAGAIAGNKARSSVARRRAGTFGPRPPREDMRETGQNGGNFAMWVQSWRKGYGE